MTINEKDIPVPGEPLGPPGPEVDILKKGLEQNVEEKSISESEGEKKERSGSMKDFARIFTFAERRDIVLFLASVFMSIAAGASLPLMTIIFGGFTTKFNDFATGVLSPSQFERQVDHYTLYFVYLFIGRLIVSYLGNLTVSIAAVRTTRNIRFRVLQSTIRQEIWHFDKDSNGSIASQVTTNGNRINQGIAEKMAAAVQAISLFFSAFVVALSVQWKLALITMSIIPFTFVISGIGIPIDIKYESQINKIYSVAGVLAQEALSSIKTVHAFWAHDKLVRKYDKFLEEAHQIGKKRSKIWGIVFSTQNFTVLAGSALAFWEGTRMYRSGEIRDVGTVFTVVLSVTIGTTAVSIIAPQLLAVTGAASAAAELFEIIDKESLLDPLASGGEQPTSCEGNIEIRNLAFAYPSRPAAQVLHNLSISIPAGKTTALVGASGCGKSTIVGLLERWYEPGSGEILLDGRNVSSYNTQWLRNNIRLVQQEPVLFRGTIFDNVAKGFVGPQKDLSREEQMELVQEACKSSNAHDFIMDLPEGYDTEVGERASMLSGGQKQRVAIARSIISDPKVLLLDEATSALDPRAEGIVQDALNRVSANKTTLVIAHKLATVKLADNIIVMSRGEVVEQGTHESLIARKGQYAALVHAQDLGAREAARGEAEVAEDDSTEEKANVLERKHSVAATERTNDEKLEKLTSGTMGHSLIRCLWVMLPECKETHWRLWLGAIACLIGGGVYPAEALIFSHLIHVFTLHGDAAAQQANFFSLMLFVVALAQLVAYFVIGWVANDISQMVTHRYRKELMQRLMYLDQDFFDRSENSSGALTSRLSSVPQSVQELISANLLLLLIVIVNLIASTTLALAYGWKLGLVVAFGGLPLLMGSGFAQIYFDLKFQEDTDKRFAESAAIATEAVTSIRTVASLTMEEGVLKQYSALLDNIVSSAVRAFALNIIGYAFSQGLEFLVMALGFWYGSRLLASGEYTVTQFFVIFVAIVFGGQAAGMFFGYSSTITKATTAANYLLWLRTIQPHIAENSSNEGKGPNGDGVLEIDNLEFKYIQRNSAKVLKGIDMEIKPGSYIACVGASGCGKSTLISLLERFYDPTSGNIILNDQNIADMSPRLYRNHMSLVQQEPTLYQGSVRENVALGLQHEPSDDEINEACRQANASEFISSLPEGLATSCGTKGTQFSGGQRQRIAIARALIRQPRLLLLDEATSALDTQSERIVQKTLDEAAAERTTIAVAHRLSTIRHADVIFVFANGRIAEKGTHEELQRLRGWYYEMCLAQSLDKD